MNGLYLTLPIFLPLVGGLVSYLIRFPSTRSRHLFYGVLVCLTSAVKWLSAAAVRAFSCCASRRS